MLRKWLFIIGFMAIGTLFLPSVYAADCDPFADEYKCQEDDIVAYCATEGLGKVFENSLYGDTYCNLSFAVGYPDEVFEKVGEQLGVDEDVVRAVIEENTIPLDEIPAATKLAFLGDEKAGSADAKLNLYKVFREAFDKELLLHQVQENLTPRLEARDIYTNGSTLDSPFDLIVDLNIIEQVLFGSQAVWTYNSDVYAWPKDEDEEDGGASPTGGTGSGQTTGGTIGTPTGAGSTGGFQATQPGGTGGPTECVPPTHPDADTPAPGEIPPNCGNGVLDSGESCDDGNNRSGDGCSAECVLESSGLGQGEVPGAPMCIDPQAITFKTFEPTTAASNGPDTAPSDADATTGTTATGQNQCPPGTYPTKPPVITATADQLSALFAGIVQPANYPGPNIGGVYRSYPVSQKPECPAGSTKFDPAVFSLDVGGNVPDCIPSVWADELCDTKTWEDSSGLNAAFVSWCVEVKTANRPETPYALDENCIDCHIAASIDTLDTILSKGVAPLENTKNAFAISSRWSPNLSFDLITSVVSRIKALGKEKPKATAKIDAEVAERQREQTGTANSTDDPVDPDKQPTIPVTEPATDTLQRTQQYLAAKRKEYEQTLKTYRNSTVEQGADQEFYGRVNTLLQQMLTSFQLIQKEFIGLATDTSFQKKKDCKC